MDHSSNVRLGQPKSSVKPGFVMGAPIEIVFFYILIGAIMANQPRKTVFRDSGTGQFIPQKYAEKNPRTTEKQHVIVPKSPTKGR